jgi:hypothetical protein
VGSSNYIFPSVSLSLLSSFEKFKSTHFLLQEIVLSGSLAEIREESVNGGR